VNIETGQATRSKHESHIEHEQNPTLLSLQSRSDNALIFTSCYDLIVWHVRQSMAALPSIMASQDGGVTEHYDAPLPT